MNGNEKLESIPHALSSEDFIGLQRAMLLKNIERGVWHKYFDIQYVVPEKKWYAFYFAPVSVDVDVKILASKKGKK